MLIVVQLWDQSHHLVKRFFNASFHLGEQGLELSRIFLDTQLNLISVLFVLGFILVLQVLKEGQHFLSLQHNGLDKSLVALFEYSCHGSDGSFPQILFLVILIVFDRFNHEEEDILVVFAISIVQDGDQVSHQFKLRLD